MKSIQELEKIRQAALEKVNLRTDRKGTRIVVGMATCGISAGARPVLMALLEEAQKRNLEDVIITQTGCIGVCRLEPIIEVYKEGEGKTTYVEMTADKAKKVIADHIVNGKVVDEYTIGAYEDKGVK
ncbi:(2Fe-2S) ferredoxin domain-containing protein [Alkaliphilus serpentinus]|uniref:(2Fe-2S) ferredoxin domain-containing protein n=1 Tax=Alkaliphilus serpentinus TaxID=1482731 RepID=A0A833HRR3_9FIRM|nr:(2Fe-2S) ferredoxin domain-containing protein [Alkaliphilus serpentinus]KAB3533534.1 (2Fe-2S) ferredoxin domain-containing protein [Alkaliphilus serpentinus]